MIYLDNNATTFLDPRVCDAMLPIYNEHLGNPSSSHRYGQRAAEILTASRRSVAQFFGVKPQEILFTSGATEALNMVIASCAKPGAHIITSSLEHVAVIEALRSSAAAVTYLEPLPGKGAIAQAQVLGAIQKNTALVVLMSANNETGIKTEFQSGMGVPLLVDGVASLGKEVLELPDSYSAAAFSSHKIHGPQGVGCLIVKKNFALKPLILGGPQQYSMRGGTENLAGIVGFAKALECIDTFPDPALRDHFESLLDKVIVHGKDLPRLSNTSNIAFPGVDGESLLLRLDLVGVAASHGSACSSGSMERSRVLLNMGISRELARCSLRFSFSRFTRREEIEKAAALINQEVAALRAL